MKWLEHFWDENTIYSSIYLFHGKEVAPYRKIEIQ